MLHFESIGMIKKIWIQNFTYLNTNCYLPALLSLQLLKILEMSIQDFEVNVTFWIYWTNKKNLNTKFYLPHYKLLLISIHTSLCLQSKFTIFSWITSWLTYIYPNEAKPISHANSVRTLFARDLMLPQQLEHSCNSWISQHPLVTGLSTII
jgi:hypothetical protein